MALELNTIYIPVVYPVTSTWMIIQLTVNNSPLAQFNSEYT